MTSWLSTSGLLTLAETDPMAHVINHKWWVTEGGLWLWSGNMGNLVLSALIMLLVGPWVARKVATGPASAGSDAYVTKNVFAHMIEVICLYLREQTVRPMLGHRTERFMPFLWTLFFYILLNNILGLIPILDFFNVIFSGVSPQTVADHKMFIGGTLTQNIWVTGGLALIAFLVINIAGIVELGPVGYAKHLTGGAPVYLWWLLIPIEIGGTFIKPVALALRLFANMTAGHILLAVLLSFIGLALLTKGLLMGTAITVLAAGGVFAIYFLELFVAFLQAFVFMFLTTVFISMLAHHDDEHEHDHEHAPGAHPAHA